MNINVVDCPGCGSRKAFTGPSVKCGTCGYLVRAPKARRKYRNEPTEIGGEHFDSKKEAARWVDLRLQENAGNISNLRRQVAFPLNAKGGEAVAKYVADFVYHEGGVFIVEDCKGYRTALYKLKKKWLAAQYGITIRET